MIGDNTLFDNKSKMDLKGVPQKYWRVIPFHQKKVSINNMIETCKKLNFLNENLAISKSYAYYLVWFISVKSAKFSVILANDEFHKFIKMAFWIFVLCFKYVWNKQKFHKNVDLKACLQFMWPEQLKYILSISKKYEPKFEKNCLKFYHQRARINKGIKTKY